MLILTTTGHPLRSGPLSISVGYSMLEWFTAGVLILMLYAYRAKPLQPGLGIFVFFGEISYGLYLIHVLCGTFYDRVFGYSYRTHAGDLLIRFVAVNSFAILLATLSKRFFENPIMRLRDRIPAAQ